MAATLNTPAKFGFQQVVIPGFVIQVASRRTDRPMVMYYTAAAGFTQDYTQAKRYTTAPMADPDIAAAKTLLSPEVLSAVQVVAVNKIVLLTQPT